MERTNAIGIVIGGLALAGVITLTIKEIVNAVK
jgi:hypothetical protein